MIECQVDVGVGDVDGPHVATETTSPARTNVVHHVHGDAGGDLHSECAGRRRRSGHPIVVVLRRLGVVEPHLKVVVARELRRTRRPARRGISV